jgi:GTP-binding protein HflX
LYEFRAIRKERLEDDGTFHLRVALPWERLRGLCRAAGVEPPPAPRSIEDWETPP